MAFIILLQVEFLFGEALGVDPLYTTIPATFIALLLDQILLRGAVFETIYQSLVPVYKDKIIAHEAGHFLIAYLLGVPGNEFKMKRH